MCTTPGRLVAISTCLILFVGGLAGFGQVPADDQKAIEQVVVQLYNARVQKDLVTFSALFSPKAPRTTSRPSVNFDSASTGEVAKRIEQATFPYDRLEVTHISVSRLARQATTITARVTVELVITPPPPGTLRAERWIRNMVFAREGEAWTVWREAPAAEDLAAEIAAAPADARSAILDANRDLISEELAFGIEGQADRLWASTTPNAKAAIALYEFEIGMGEEVNSVVAVSRCHMKIAQILQLSSPDAAIGHFEKALEGFKAIEDRGRLAKVEEGLAICYYNRDNTKACDHYLRAIELFTQVDDKYALAGSLHGYGNAAYLVGDWAGSLDAYRRSLELQQALGIRSASAVLLQAIGRVQKDEGDYDAAIESYEKSLADKSFMTYATQFGGLSGLGDVYRLQGRFEMSLEHHGRALALTQSSQDDQGTMQVEADLGNVYLSEQQPVAALEHYKKSLTVAETLRNQAGIARALASVGLAQFSDMQYPAAIESYCRAVPIREALNDEGEVAWLHAHIGMAQSALEKHEDALASFQKAFDISSALNNAAAIAVMQVLLAAEHFELDHLDQAVDLAGRAAELAQAIESDDTLARARLVAGRALRTKGDRNGAEGAFREAVAAVEFGRARIADERRGDFFGDTGGPYRAMAVLQAERGNRADALVFAERAQLALLGDVLTGNRALIVDGLSREEQSEELRLNRQQKSLRVQAEKERDRAKPDSARLESLKAKLADAEQQRKAFADMIYTAHPMLKRQRGIIDAANPEQFGAMVPDANTAVVEFVTTDRQTMILVVSKRPMAPAGPPDVQTRIIDVKLLDLARQVRDFRGLIRHRDDGVSKAARALNDLLLAPIRDAIAGKTRLVVVPDGPLWSLPFQALQSSDGRFLIERCAVSYAPSLTVLALVAGGSLAAPASAGRRVVLAVANQLAGSAADRLKLLNASVNLAPMPNAEQEARRLAVLYGAGRAKLHVGDGATEDILHADAKNAALLHVATFFVPNVAAPFHSPIVLSASETGPTEVAEIWEMMHGSMPPFAVISRVQIDRVASDGTVPVGLSWVFFVAGAKTTVLATWPDDSRAAMSLMLRLHRNLSRTAGGTAGAGRALRQAILPMLAGKYRHPFYWANYAVIGLG